MNQQQKQRPQLSRNDSAKHLRRALKLAFPRTKFSVTCGRGTAWSSCYVRWSGGPLGIEVEDITNNYDSQGFDGMTDSTTHLQTSIAVDGVEHDSGLGMVLLTRDGFIA